MGDLEPFSISSPKAKKNELMWPSVQLQNKISLHLIHHFYFPFIVLSVNRFLHSFLDFYFLLKEQ